VDGQWLMIPIPNSFSKKLPNIGISKKILINEKREAETLK